MTSKGALLCRYYYSVSAVLARHTTRLAHEMREGDYTRMQVALDETLERLVAVRTPSQLSHPPYLPVHKAPAVLLHITCSCITG